MKSTYVRVVIVWVAHARRPLRLPVVLHPLNVAIDWTIIGVYLVWIVWDGIRLSKNTDKLEGYFLASKSLPWWAVGLSVMATQLSAITMVSSTGQGYADGMGLLQQYYALPIAMIIISVTFVPFFRHANVYTAYEYLEAPLRREDALVHGAAVPDLARHVDRRRHLGAGGRAVGDDRRRRQHHLRPARGADRDLHDVRRRAGGGLDRRQADVPDRRRPAGRGRRADPGSARYRQRRTKRCTSPAPPAGCRRSTSRPIRPCASRSGPAPSARCSCSCRTSAPIRARCSATSPRSRWTKRARRSS